MKKLLIVLAVILLFTGPASATVINFDDQSGPPWQSQIPNGYSGFNWDNFWFDNPVAFGNGEELSGFVKGTVSGAWIAFNGLENPASLSRSGSFDFNSAYFKAYSQTVQLTIFASLNNNLKYEEVITIDGSSSTDPYFFHPDWIGIDTLYFSTDPKQGFSMDNLTVTTVPAPAAIYLIGSGLLALGGLRLKRKMRS